MFTQAIDVLLQIHCQIFEYQVETSIRKNNITKPSIQKRRSVAVPIRRSRLTEQCFDGEVLSRWIFHEWQLREHHHLLLLIESSSMRRSVTLADDRLCRQCHMYLRWTRGEGRMNEKPTPYLLPLYSVSQNHRCWTQKACSQLGLKQTQIVIFLSFEYLRTELKHRRERTQVRRVIVRQYDLDKDDDGGGPIVEERWKPVPIEGRTASKPKPAL